MLKKMMLTLALAGLLFAASPTAINRNAQWPPQAGSQYGFGGPFEIYWQVVPQTLTDVCSGATCGDVHLIAVTFYNSGASAATITFQTKDASPLPLPLSGSIAAGTSVSWNQPAGLLSKGGFSIEASASGVYYSAVWTN
jgi:hypothetical protein